MSAAVAAPLAASSGVAESMTGKPAGVPPSARKAVSRSAAATTTAGAPPIATCTAGTVILPPTSRGKLDSAPAPSASARRSPFMGHP